ARIERSGDKRWLVVSATPAQVWPRIREFWIEQGFLINQEDPSIGIMETDWAEQRAEFKAGFIKNILNKLNEALYGAATRDKFRTRLERGAEPGTTEIFVSHRGAEEVSTGKVTRAQDDTASRDESRVWQPRPADPELEAEMLNRMLVSFGIEEQRAAGMLARSRDKRDRAKMVRDQDGIKALSLDENFSRAWRRTGLALDRVGFTVEDRDRSRGLYFVRYVDPDADISGKKKGFFSKLKFWGSDDKPDRDNAYLISLIGGKDGDESTQVVILNKRGEPESSDTADRILGLLHEQLK
ncbi:MAG TPA: outer membrane protein assembly factor BamC, partial [Gammaproteobacteria bacterium]